MPINADQMVILSSIGVYIGERFYRFRVKPYLVNKRIRAKLATEEYSRALQLTKESFKGFDGFSASIIERQTKGLKDKTLAYGEINLQAFAEILLATKEPLEGVFVDLGCGSGKAVILAALMGEFQQVRGIELLDKLNELAQTAKDHLLNSQLSKEELQKARAIIFKKADFLNEDLSEATIIFAHATCFGEVLWQKLGLKLNGLMKGARVIVVSKTLSHQHFKLQQTVQKQMTWGTASVYIYEKK